MGAAGGWIGITAEILVVAAILLRRFYNMGWLPAEAPVKPARAA